MPTTGKSKPNKMMRWTVAALIVALLAAWAVPPPAAEAATGQIRLKSPQEIEFNTYNGVTQMYIADTGNNRVLRANVDGLVNLTIPVPNPTAIAIDEKGHLYVATSGSSAGLYAFDRDGNALELKDYNNAAIQYPINLMISPFFTPSAGVPDNMNVKSLIVVHRFNNFSHKIQTMAYFHCETYQQIGYNPPSYGPATSRCGLDLSLSGMSGGGSGQQGEMGYAYHNDGKMWESGGDYVDLEDVFNMFAANGDRFGEIAVDPIGKMFYVVVNETRIDRTSYVGASYSNRPTLQPWLNLADKYGIIAPHSIAVGPDGALYVTDAANDRIIVIGLDSDATFNRELSLTGEINDPPTAGSFTKRNKQNQTIAFDKAEFLSRYSDPNNHAMQAIRIASLPSHGTLSLNGNPVTEGQVIPEGNLGGLTYTPHAGWGGTTSFEWLAKDSEDYSETAGKVEIIVRIMGDANGDGAVTPADALLITKYVKGTITLTADQLEMLDMNGDGVVDAADATIIMNIYSGKAI
ncbi:hypothetical protein J4772_27585 [Cohnella sp. LGH]|uniref:dockerin type I domain-containing protein n=1 Tax=Cohnella sp. LGH TaxID=1619153 RepID=UPI001ADBEA59|nr:dockerin type I domain-containing protein [Cohnella sp. LGH]QTH41280.1 hypothetical protein J4772_27585 [Cohnella sp. LGH]